jgi:hypothetical protein
MVLCPRRKTSHVIMEIIMIFTRLYGVMFRKEDISCNYGDYHDIYQTVRCYVPEGRNLILTVVTI